MPSTESRRLPSQKWCDDWQDAFDTSPDLEIIEAERSSAQPPSEVAHSLLDLDEPRELRDIASRLSGQLEALAAETSTAADLRRGLASQRAALAKAREQIAQELAMVHKRVQGAVDDAVLAARANLEGERRDLREDRTAVEADRGALELDRQQLNQLLSALVGTREELAQRARLGARTESSERLQALREEHRAELDQLVRERDELHRENNRLRVKLVKNQQRLVKATHFMRKAGASVSESSTKTPQPTISPAPISSAPPPPPPAPRASEAQTALLDLDQLDTPEARARAAAAERKGRAPTRGRPARPKPEKKPEKTEGDKRVVAPRRRGSLARRRF